MGYCGWLTRSFFQLFLYLRHSVQCIYLYFIYSSTAILYDIVCISHPTIIYAHNESQWPPWSNKTLLYFSVIILLLRPHYHHHHPVSSSLILYNLIYRQHKTAIWLANSSLPETVSLIRIQCQEWANMTHADSCFWLAECFSLDAGAGQIHFLLFPNQEPHIAYPHLMEHEQAVLLHYAWLAMY